MHHNGEVEGPMNLKKTMIRSVAAVSASALPVVLSGQPVGAESYSDSESVPWSYQRASNGQVVECQITAFSSLTRPGTSGPFQADAFTSTGPQSDECRANLVMSFSYLAPDGTTRRGSVSATGGGFSVDWNEEGVAGQLVVEHQFAFTDCFSGCGGGIVLETKPK
jgi:hypothetical protein